MEKYQKSAFNTGLRKNYILHDNRGFFAMLASYIDVIFQIFLLATNQSFGGIMS